MALLAAQSDVPSLAECQAIQDAASRLACYDRIASPAEKAVTPAAAEQAAVPPAPSQEEVLMPAAAEQAAVPPAPSQEEVLMPAAAEQAAASPPPSQEEVLMPAADEQPTVMSAPPADPEELSDEIGRETVKGNQTDDRELSVRGRLVNCERGRSSKFVFYFDNGQVWRQKDNKRVSWTECNVEVTISKDFFGYKMVRDDDDRTVRIERVE